jgi:hypothetical protein
VPLLEVSSGAKEREIGPYSAASRECSADSRVGSAASGSGDDDGEWRSERRMLEGAVS